jgi:tetratricopeptide (TPR) repeat protein
VGQPFWNVPHPRNPAFTGRKDTLSDLRARLTRRGRTALAQAISGLGGIGKTQAAVEYAYRHRGDYQAVLWLNAETPAELKAGCGEIARRMDLPYPKDDLDRAVETLKGWLKDNTGWLLILDNADEPATLEHFLPEAGHGHVLITTQAHDLQVLGIPDPVELPNLPPGDATEFLLKRCDRQDAPAGDREAAGELARALDGLPLALEQAAAYIMNRQTTFRSYLEGYGHRGLKLLEAHAPALGSHPVSVVKTWSANFEAVEEESPATADVLRFSAFLAPDNIPIELISQGAPDLGALVVAAFAEAVGDPLVVNDLLQPLARFSLIRINVEAEVYSIHRLVQEVLKDTMDQPTRRQWRERAVRAASRAFPPVEYVNWSRCERLLPHALAAVSGLGRDEGQIEEAGRLLNVAADYLATRGQYTEAEPLAREAVGIFRTTLGERHPAYAISLNDLAWLYRVMGRHAEAEPLAEEAVGIFRTALGERHPAYAASLDNLAWLYRETGRHAEAEPLLVEAIEIRRTALGERHPDYAISLHNLAWLYRSMGRHAEAEPLAREAVGIFRTALGERHPAYAASLFNLEWLYLQLGRHAEAEPLAEEAVGIFTALGERHPAYAASLFNLEWLYHTHGPARRSRIARPTGLAR